MSYLIKIYPVMPMYIGIPRAMQLIVYSSANTSNLYSEMPIYIGMTG